ncbi:DUF2793 domain-containing protein [Sphingomonas naphthae]|uniref:DUF2793 domain-containing protein n=1 Tax=Sphingomonas naphthae TaxID=1813468 RepID=A0ABY7TKJ6_9SPHN|nr:DUF2793 domain-containing protein [Sphingomonas naphthae]WCT73684.1 DUF2793 domain-containing protein [Sphingomonas naphthae]
MSEQSTRFDLPYLQAGQAQKELFHNEALATIDLLLHANARNFADAPPAGPAIGECWIVGDAPTGAWAGRAGALAGFTGGGWRFAAPQPGMAVWLTDPGLRACYHHAAWHVGDAVPETGGGTTIDTEARAAIGAILVALKTQGLIPS